MYNTNLKQRFKVKLGLQVGKFSLVKNLVKKVFKWNLFLSQKNPPGPQNYQKVIFPSPTSGFRRALGGGNYQVQNPKLPTQLPHLVLHIPNVS